MKILIILLSITLFCAIGALICGAFFPPITKEERKRKCGNPNCHIHGNNYN